MWAQNRRRRGPMVNGSLWSIFAVPVTPLVGAGTGPMALYRMRPGFPASIDRKSVV